MYRISNDTRILASAAKITTGLDACLENHSISEISISLLCKQSDTGRTTFYRIFDTVSDVLQYYCDNAIKSTCEKLALSDKKTLRDSALNSFGALMKHPRILDAIMMSGRADIIFNSYLDYETDLKKRASTIVPEDQVQLDYLIHMANAMLTAALQVWHYHGKKDSCEDIYRHIKNEAKLITEIL